MLHTLKKQLPTISPTSMLTASRLSIKIKPKLKSGLRNMMSSWPVIPSPSKPPSFWVMSSSRWVSSQSLSLKEKRLLPKLTNWSTQSSSSPRKPHALELLLEPLRPEKITLGKTWRWQSTSWFPWWRKAGKMLEPSTSRLRWENHTESLADLQSYLNIILLISSDTS